MDSLSNHPPIEAQLDIDNEALRGEIADALHDIVVPEIASDADVAAAREIVKPLQALQKKVEATRVETKEPYLESERAVDAFFKKLRATLDKMVEDFTKAANAFQTKKRDEALKIAAAKARIAAAVGEAAPPPVAAKETVRVSTDAGVAASGTVKWDYEVIDAAHLPRELLMPNKEAIKARVAGLKATLKSIDDAKIPGVRIFEKVGTTWR